MPSKESDIFFTNLKFFPISVKSPLTNSYCLDITFWVSTTVAKKVVRLFCDLLNSSIEFISNPYFVFNLSRFSWLNLTNGLDFDTETKLVNAKSFLSNTTLFFLAHKIILVHVLLPFL